METDTITLDDGWQEVVRVVSEMRTSYNRTAGVKDQKIGPQSGKVTDLDGLGGEVAFCLLHNLCPDLCVVPRSGGYDCVTHVGKTVDVKTTKYRGGKLTAKLGTDITEIDLFALMVGEFPTYRWVGWAWAADLVCADTVGDLGHGPTHILTQEQIKPSYKVVPIFGMAGVLPGQQIMQELPPEAYWT